MNPGRGGSTFALSTLIFFSHANIIHPDSALSNLRESWRFNTQRGGLMFNVEKFWKHCKRFSDDTILSLYQIEHNPP